MAAGGNQEAAQTYQEDSTYQDPVIKLYSCRILKDIPQHRGEGKEIIWDPALPHFGEGIVHKASIQPCHKGTCNSRAENETTRAGKGATPACTALIQELSLTLNFLMQHMQRSHSTGRLEGASPAVQERPARRFLPVRSLTAPVFPQNGWGCSQSPPEKTKSAERNESQLGQQKERALPERAVRKMRAVVP